MGLHSGHSLVMKHDATLGTSCTARPPSPQWLYCCDRYSLQTLFLGHFVMSEPDGTQCRFDTALYCSGEMVVGIDVSRSLTPEMAKSHQMSVATRMPRQADKPVNTHRLHQYRSASSLDTFSTRHIPPIPHVSLQHSAYTAHKKI
jgi:hypothetical protein